jgi:hypothetical protein
MSGNVPISRELLRAVSRELLSAYAAQMGRERYNHAAFVQPQPDRLESVLREIDRILKR